MAYCHIVTGAKSPANAMFEKTKILWASSLHQFDEARGANKARQDDPLADKKGGRTRVERVTLSYRTLSNPRRKGPISTSHLFCWRPRRDFEPVLPP
jgi:hypothetical protein